MVGIAASGRTPFVWGALEQARRQGATVALVCCHPRLRFVKGSKPDILIALPTGPEVLAGSTRLKAGTATKLVLNAVTTLAMVQLGKVAGNLMIDLNPSNQKLRDRAVRIVTTLSGASTEAAELALNATTWKISDAAQCLGWKPPARRARNRK
jgi:N-acetylmuramic acid 6-phosphate (MurNAc-6-P) etherase